MKSLSRVVWAEGMYLGPHHFQAQSRYFEDSIRFATDALWNSPYGVAGYEFSAEALRNGTVALVHARGIFPDGLIFHMPDADPLPAPREIGDLFPPTRDHVTILLAVPPHKPDGVNCVVPVNGATPPSEGVRYVAETYPLHDETTGRDEKPIRVGRKNIRLLLDTEVPLDMVALPLARIARSSSGEFVFDPLFVPPCVEIAASARLMTLLGRLIEIMEEKSATLDRPAQGGAAFSTREIANFWFLHAVNSSLAPLRHLYLARRGHPEHLYGELARLAGALCTFALDSHPRAIPAYDHDRPDKCFNALDEHIRRHLDVIVPTNCISIPVKPAGDYLHFGDVLDQRCLAKSSAWILGMRADTGDADLIAKTRQLVKVCSEVFVPELVKRALPGLTLTHLPVPPSAVSARIGTQYFLVTRGGPCWDHIVQTQKVGIYVPGEFPNPEIQLLAVLDDHAG